MKTVKAIREGRIVLRKPEENKSRFYALWSENDAPRSDHPMHMPMPKLKLPTHAESYNPPAEYLFTKEEREEWENAEPSDRKTDFIPQKYDCLRKVPGYRDFVQQRFERLLDLYLAPRTRRRRPKLDITDPEELVPKLPDPKELRPFPTHCSVLYPHPNGVRTRCVSIDPAGMWLVTGADDGEVRLWELATGRCAATWKVEQSSPVYAVEWSPDKEHALFAATRSVLNFVIGKTSLVLKQKKILQRRQSYNLFTTGYPRPVHCVGCGRLCDTRFRGTVQDSAGRCQVVEACRRAAARARSARGGHGTWDAEAGYVA
jgi:ribosome biogenesis protein ERB1